MKTGETPRDLIYYPDSEPGIARLRWGRGFRYVAPDGTSIDDRSERTRIKALAVPPAYEGVWISPKPNSHLLATGRDVRKRKQYRYHPSYRAAKEAQKFDTLADFGRALPRIRRAIRRDLGGDAGDVNYAIAAILALLDRVAMRVGNTEYTNENGSYGATTLTDGHLNLDGDAINLNYTAKGGKRIKRKLLDRTLHRVLSRMHDLPGGTLISWLDDDGAPQAVTADQVNAQLAALVETPGITAKTFRTWAGSVAALDTLLGAEKPTIKAVSEAAAARLGNTPTIARNSYIHPAVIGLVGADAQSRQALAGRLSDIRGLRQSEIALLQLLGRE